MHEVKVIEQKLNNLNKSVTDSLEFGAKIKPQTTPHLEIYHFDVDEEFNEEKGTTLFDEILNIVRESSLKLQKIKVKIRSSMQQKVQRVKNILEKYEFDQIKIEDVDKNYFLDGELSVKSDHGQ